MASGQKTDLLEVSGRITGASGLNLVVEALSGSAATVTDYTALPDQTVVRGASIDSDSYTLMHGGSLPATLVVTSQRVQGSSDEIQLSFSTMPITQLSSKTFGKPLTQNQKQVLSSIVATATGHIASGAAAAATVTSTQGVVTPLATTLATVTNSALFSLASFHPEAYSSYLTVGLEQLDTVGYRVLHRAGAASFSCDGTLAGFCDPCQRQLQPQDWVLWQDFSYHDGTVDGKNDLGSFKYRLFDCILVADLLRSCDWSAGVFLGYGRSEMHEHDAVVHDLETDSYYAGLYGRYHMGCWTFRGSFSYHCFDTDSTRPQVAVDTFVSTADAADLLLEAKANYNTDAYHMRLAAYRCIDWGCDLSVIPHASLSFSYLDQDRIVEEGDAFSSYIVDAASADSWTTGIGVEVVKKICGSLRKWYQRAHLHYAYDWSASNHSEHELDVAL